MNNIINTNCQRNIFFSDFDTDTKCLEELREKILKELTWVVGCERRCLIQNYSGDIQNYSFCTQKIQIDKCGEIFKLLQGTSEKDIKIGIILGKIFIYTKLFAGKMLVKEEFGDEGKVKTGNISLQEYQSILSILFDLLKNQKIVDYIFLDEAKARTFMYTLASFFRVTALFSAYSFQAEDITRLLLFHMTSGMEFGKKKTLQGYLRWINDMLDYTIERSKVAFTNTISEEIFFFSHWVLFGKYTQNIDDLCDSILKGNNQYISSQYGIFLTNLAVWLYYSKGNKDTGYKIAQRAWSIKKELDQTSKESFLGIEAAGILLDYYVQKKAYDKAIELVFEIPLENLQQKTGPTLGFMEQFCVSRSNLSIPFFQNFSSFDNEKKKRFFYFIQHLFGLNFIPNDFVQVNEVIVKEYEKNKKRNLRNQEILRLMRIADQQKQEFFVVIKCDDSYVPVIQNKYREKNFIKKYKSSGDFFCWSSVDQQEFSIDFSMCPQNQKDSVLELLETYFPELEKIPELEKMKILKHTGNVEDMYSFLEACGKRGYNIFASYDIHYINENGKFVAKNVKMFPLFVLDDFMGIGIINNDVTEYVSILKNFSTQAAYAKMLLFSLFLPSDIVLKKYFQDNFVIYLQFKDSIGGDFYRAKEITVNGKKQVLIAVGDCTGHGVPGALLSVLGISFLNEIVDDGSYKPNTILEKLNKKFYEKLNNFRSFPEKQESFFFGRIKDGMDLALFLVDPEQKTIEYAGANRPLRIVRNGKIIEYNPTKVSIGMNSEENYSLQLIYLQPGDILCAFSDGIVDQFGGEMGKKLGKKGLQTFLLELLQCGEITENTKKKIELFLKKWMGGNEQVDDNVLFLVEIT